MVNENQGKEYEPRPVYNRKMLRNVLRFWAKKTGGSSDVNKRMSEKFHEIRG